MKDSRVDANANEVGHLLERVQSLRSELLTERARSLAASEHFYAEQETALKAYELLERRNAELVKRYDQCRETVVAQLARLEGSCEQCQAWEKDEAQQREETLRDVLVRQREKLKEKEEESRDLKKTIGTLLMKFLTSPDVTVDLDHPGLKKIFDLLDTGGETTGQDLRRDKLKTTRVEPSVVSNTSSTSGTEDTRKDSKSSYLQWMYPERKSGASMVV